jgi:hypothetical protein
LIECSFSPDGQDGCDRIVDWLDGCGRSNAEGGGGAEPSEGSRGLVRFVDGENGVVRPNGGVVVDHARR